MHQKFCFHLFKTAYIPSPSHRALNLYKQTLIALCIGEGICALFFIQATLKGRQQKLDGSVLGICFLRVWSTLLSVWNPRSIGLLSSWTSIFILSPISLCYLRDSNPGPLGPKARMLANNFEVRTPHWFVLIIVSDLISHCYSSIPRNSHWRAIIRQVWSQ